MRSKSATHRNYTSKKKETKQNLNAIQYEEPTLTLQNAAYKMIVNKINELYKVMNIRYYEHLQEIYDIVWSDTSDKGKTLLETQVKVSEIMTETNKNSKNKTSYNLWNYSFQKPNTIYHNTVPHNQYSSYSRKPKINMG